MSRTTREPCGCRHDGHKWVAMCEACAAEFQERHQRALAEHQSMGIKEGKAAVPVPAPSPKAAPTPEGLAALGVPSQVVP